MSAVALLHNHVLQQEDVSGAAAKTTVKGQKPKEAQAPAEGLLLWARQVSGEGAHLKKWRLILRNLPFNVRTEYTFSICALPPFICMKGSVKVRQSEAFAGIAAGQSMHFLVMMKLRLDCSSCSPHSSPWVCSAGG